MFCNPVKLMLCYKLNTLPDHHRHTAMSLNVVFVSLYHSHRNIIAERRERSEGSEANNRVLFEILRYLYIYVCLTVHTLRKSYHVGHCAFGTQAAVQSTTLRSRPFARYGRRRQFC